MHAPETCILQCSVSISCDYAWLSCNTPRCIVLQVQAVDSEFTGVQQADQCRLLGAMSHMVREGHPLHTFMWGNKRSLWDSPHEAGIDVRARIIEHYRQQYSSSRMRLVMLSGHSLDELQQWTVSKQRLASYDAALSLV